MLARIFWRFPAGLVGLLLAYSPVFAADTASITKIESRSLPPYVVTHRIFSQLATKMRLEPYPTGRAKPKLPLSDMQFWTVPRATYVPGLCESDLVTIYFTPVSGPRHGADTKVMASGLRAENSFQFLSEPTFPLGETDDTSHVKQNKACAALKQGKFFGAADEDVAVSAVKAFQRVVRQAQSDAPMSLTCQFTETSPDECRRSVAKLALANITGAKRCAAGVNMDCSVVWVSSPDRSLTIHSRAGDGEIIKVDVGETVTVSDPRAD